jgi:hypothetical protein
MIALVLVHLGLVFLASIGPNYRAEAAQESPCDPTLNQVSQNPQGYKLRGDRCEGIYIQPVSSSSLLVASFTSFFEEFDPDSLESLSIDWVSPAKTPVRLRANALREKLYYQMDTVITSGRTTYSWPGTVLNSLHLSKKDIGVVGFTNFRIGGEDRTLYLPLRIRGKSQTTAPGYQIILVPGSELKEVFFSLAKLDANGQAHTFSISDRPLRRGYYPAERGISIEVPNPGQPGMYYLEIGAITKYGGPLTKQVFFYNSGAR